MTKQEYLAALEKALKSINTNEAADILNEYEEHFNLKIADGYSEAETADRLGTPEELAVQFKEITPRVYGRVGTKIVLGIGFFFLNSMLAIPLIASLYAMIISLGATAIAVGAGGLFMVAGLGRPGSLLSDYVDTLYMPYLSSLLLGFALLALAALAVIGTIYCLRYANHLVKNYIGWHKTAWTGRKKPPASLHPVIAPKRRRLMRTIALISLIAFAVTFIAGTVSLVIAAGEIEFWHAWQWFE
ncbi:MAG: DUF1700 domain-containing protein [Oscillospiraceae bacterium]|nr:DUF1700 domain-containing protein [Oscillospiraceae bacterium]